ncbi:hypothetical protein WJX82_007217 [Trebouxia sp. C0006]
MSSAQAPFSEPVYATPKEPRELTAEDLAFISKYTGRPAETLRRHILDVWNSAKKQAFVYMCIQEFGFLDPRIAKHPSYPKVKAAHQAKEAHDLMLHVDIGTAFGQDTRLLLLQGWSHEELVATDVIAEYWALGKALFMDQDLAVPFLTCSAADNALVSNINAAHLPSGDASGVTHDTADFVWAGSVLHCMPEEDCRAFLKSAYQLLKPGGFLYGMTAGKHESSEWTYSTDGTLTGFLYSPASLESFLRSLGFCEVTMQSLDWSDLTTGTVKGTALSDIITFYFTAVR